MQRDFAPSAAPAAGATRVNALKEKAIFPRKSESWYILRAVMFDLLVRLSAGALASYKTENIWRGGYCFLLICRRLRSHFS